MSAGAQRQVSLLGQMVSLFVLIGEQETNKWSFVCAATEGRQGRRNSAGQRCPGAPYNRGNCGLSPFAKAAPSPHDGSGAFCSIGMNKTMMKIASRRSRVVIALAAALVFAGSAAEARVGRGRGSFGSRGARTWTPRRHEHGAGAAAPIQRSQVPNQGPPSIGRHAGPGLRSRAASASAPASWPASSAPACSAC